eukprot:SAG25_NODE_324_length_9786_cov_33.460308_15_plen_53_part_01
MESRACVQDYESGRAAGRRRPATEELEAVVAALPEALRRAVAGAGGRRTGGAA